MKNFNIIASFYSSAESIEPDQAQVYFFMLNSTEHTI